MSRNNRSRNRRRNVKKPIFKKWWFWVIIVVIIAAGFGSGSATKESAPATTEAVTTEAPATETVPMSEKEQIDKVVRDRISEKFTMTDIDSIDINDDLGTDKDGDYIVLVRLTWNQKNSGKTSKEMLKMYSDDLAATLAPANSSINEVAVFWTVPYLNADAKCAYERKDDAFCEMDMMWDAAFDQE